MLATGANWNSFTPLLHKGITPPGTSVINAAGLYDGLLTQAEDEFGTFYGNLAESVMIADDASWVRFRLRPEARWHDGEPVTARDVAFTYEHVRENSRHDIQSAFGMIESIEVHDERELTFHLLDLNGLSAMIVISLGKLPILPEHYWRDRDISQTTLTPPLGSGPYRVGQARQSRTILYERVPDYWGRHLAIHRGRHNFDYIRYDSYRDGTVAREAFRKGLFDFRQETDPRFWHNGYNIPARDKGWIVMRRHNYGIYVGLSRGIAINGRREHLADVRVREALTLAFDFGLVQPQHFPGLLHATRKLFCAHALCGSRRARRGRACAAGAFSTGAARTPFQATVRAAAPWLRAQPLGAVTCARASAGIRLDDARRRTQTRGQRRAVLPLHRCPFRPGTARGHAIHGSVASFGH